MHKSKCPVCGSELVSSFRKNGFNIGQCSQCALIIVMDQIEPSELQVLYNDNYYDQDQTRYIDVTKKNLETWSRRLRLLEKYYQYKNPGRILDVGCGTGTFLAVAQEMGWEAWGVEISEIGLIETAKKIDPSRVSNDLFALQIVENFDVISMWAILEHLQAPVDYLRKAHALLKPNGLLALATVNTEAWNRKLFGSKWRYFTPPEHLVYFNLYNLKKVLQDLGFEELYVATRFMDQAFLQGLGVKNFRETPWPIRKFQRLLLLPFNLVIGRLKKGDIIELVARRRQ